MQASLHTQRANGDQSRKLILYASYRFGEVAVESWDKRSRDELGLGRRRFPSMHLEQSPAADGKKHAD